MSSRRESLLEATLQAARLHQNFPLEDRSSFDVIRAATEMGFPVIYRPTKSLLGATIAFEGIGPGLLITTNRGLAAQRFTLAHELGHIVLGHPLDFELLTEEEDRRPAGEARSREEIAANDFASELLAPRGLIVSTARRQGWKPDILRTPEAIYQLSLRLGISFEATCWALVRGEIITAGTAKSLTKSGDGARISKASLLRSVKATDSWADAWRLSSGDVGTRIECGPNDLFVLEMEELPSAGYVWSLGELATEFEVVNDETEVARRYGATTNRTIVIKCGAAGVHRLTVDHRRPWSGKTAEERAFDLENFGKESAGLPRRVKAALLHGGPTLA